MSELPDDYIRRLDFEAEHLVDRGFLWYINRAAFHPRGLALGATYDEDGRIEGFTLCSYHGKTFQDEEVEKPLRETVVQIFDQMLNTPTETPVADESVDAIVVEADKEAEDATGD